MARLAVGGAAVCGFGLSSVIKFINLGTWYFKSAEIVAPDFRRRQAHAWRPVDPQTAFFDGSYEKDDPPMVYAYPPTIIP